jgi:hypothetical protein
LYSAKEKGIIALDSRPRGKASRGNAGKDNNGNGFVEVRQPLIPNNINQASGPCDTEDEAILVGY